MVVLFEFDFYACYWLDYHAAVGPSACGRESLGLSDSHVVESAFHWLDFLLVDCGFRLGDNLTAD